MPLFNFYCETCDVHVRKILDSIKEISCPKCKNPLQRDVGALNYSTKEIIDNGLMPKSLERFTDIEEKMKERTENSKKRE